MARRRNNIKEEIARLGGLNRNQLGELWIKNHGAPAPSGLRQPIMLRSAAWHRQRELLGPTSGRVQRQIALATRRVEVELQKAQEVNDGLHGVLTSELLMQPVAKSIIGTEARVQMAMARGPDDGAVSETAALDISSSPPAQGTVEARASKSAKVRNLPVPGSRLIREWNGRSYIIDVVQDGYLFDGKIWRSLTAIAKRITGIHRSGPEFFGL